MRILLRRKWRSYTAHHIKNNIIKPLTEDGPAPCSLSGISLCVLQHVTALRPGHHGPYCSASLAGCPHSSLPPSGLFAIPRLIWEAFFDHSTLSLPYLIVCHWICTIYFLASRFSICLPPSEAPWGWKFCVFYFLLYHWRCCLENKSHAGNFCLMNTVFFPFFFF